MVSAAQTGRVPVMTTHRSATASISMYGSMVELLDSARNRRTMMMVITLPNTPRSIATGRRTVVTQARLLVNEEEDMSKFAADRGETVVSGVAVVLKGETVLLLSMVTERQCNFSSSTKSRSKMVFRKM